MFTRQLTKEEDGAAGLCCPRLTHRVMDAGPGTGPGARAGTGGEGGRATGHGSRVEGGKNTASSFSSSSPPSPSSNPPPCRHRCPPQRNGHVATVDAAGGVRLLLISWAGDRAGYGAGGLLARVRGWKHGRGPNRVSVRALRPPLSPLLILTLVVLLDVRAAVDRRRGRRSREAENGTATRVGQDRPREAGPQRRRGGPGTRWRR